jgi:hypothetical protein
MTELDFTDLDHSVDPSLSSNLSKDLSGKTIVFSRYDEKSHIPIGKYGSQTALINPEAITPIKCIQEPTLVAAVDSSSIKIAETESGCLYAIKCGVAFATNGQPLMHFKLGPILFYLSEETVKKSELDYRIANLVLFDVEYAKRLTRIQIERAIQTYLSNHLSNSIILVDGSLNASPFENRGRNIKKIAENCSIRRNVLFGISKSTSFRVLSKISAALIQSADAAYMNIQVIIQSLSRTTIGDNFLVKFGSRDSPILRVDIACCDDLISHSLGKLVANDSVARGYPETLRLAHHVSTLTNMEVSCLKAYLLSNFDITQLESEDIRKTLLGSITR